MGKIIIYNSAIKQMMAIMIEASKKLSEIGSIKLPQKKEKLSTKTKIIFW